MQQPARSAANDGASVQGCFAADIRKYYRIDCGTETPPFLLKLRLWVGSFGLHCVAVYRLDQWSRSFRLRNRLIGFVPRLVHFVLAYIMEGVHHVRIEGATIGPGFYIAHVGTIYIGACTIGSNVNVAHNVSVGQGRTPGKAGVPMIGDNVWIGTGSVLFGAITIGSNVTIMAGSILSRDIPDNCLVGGNPARVAMQNYERARPPE